MNTIRSLFFSAMALGLVSASAFAAAQDSSPIPERQVGAQLVMSLDDLKNQGIFVSCRDDLAYVSESVFVGIPSDGTSGKPGWMYNACMKISTGVCGTYENGKLVSISEGCIEQSHKACD